MPHHIKKVTAIALIIAAVPLFILSCKRPSAQTGVLPDSIKEFKFQGGTLKEGKIILDPDIKVEPGQTKNTVTLRRLNDSTVTVNCFCILEGGDCWAVSNPVPGGGGIGLGCAHTNCAGGGDPFCLMHMNDPGAFDIRFAVRSSN